MQIGPPVSAFDQFKLLFDTMADFPSVKYLRKSFCNIIKSATKVVDPVLKKCRTGEINFLVEPRISVDGFSEFKKSIPYFYYDYRVSSNYLKADIFIEKELVFNYERLYSNWKLFEPRFLLIAQSAFSLTNKSEHFLSIGAVGCISSSMAYASSKIIDSSTLLGKPISYILLTIDDLKILKKRIDLEFSKSIYTINFRCLMKNMREIYLKTFKFLTVCTDLSYLLSDSYQESEWELLLASIDIKLDLGLKSLNCVYDTDKNLPKISLKSVLEHPKFK